MGFWIWYVEKVHNNPEMPEVARALPIVTLPLAAWEYYKARRQGWSPANQEVR